MGRSNKKRDIKIGDKFGDFIVVSDIFIEKRYRKIKVQCRCGTILTKHCCEVASLTRCKKCSTKSSRTVVAGATNNMIEVLERYDNRKILIKCKCGNQKIVSASSFSWLKSCGCLQFREGRESPHYKGIGQISSSMFSQIKRNARKRNLDFNLDMEYLSALFISQDEKCALTNLPILIGNKNVDTTASLDRINNNIGYIKGNVWWVHKDVNRMKTDFNLNYFKSICGLVVDKMGEPA